ncbi:MAG: hypothetical protein J2P47_05575 [Acetobacteraceae bacterium]|nr:hypothetical protein [Acetobacteraceae bacterium]
MWLRARIVALPGRIYRRLVGDGGEAGSAAAAGTADPGQPPVAEPGWTGWLLLKLSAAPRPSPGAPLPALSAEEVGAEAAGDDRGKEAPDAVPHREGRVTRGPWPEPRLPRA